MRNYEMMIIFDEDVLAFEECRKFVNSTLSANGFEIIDEKDMGVRDLAYEINRKRRGHYNLVHYKGEAAGLQEAARLFKLNNCIMRYINLNQEE